MTTVMFLPCITYTEIVTCKLEAIVILSNINAELTIPPIVSELKPETHISLYFFGLKQRQ